MPSYTPLPARFLPIVVKPLYVKPPTPWFAILSGLGILTAISLTAVWLSIDKTTSSSYPILARLINNINRDRVAQQYPPNIETSITTSSTPVMTSNEHAGAYSLPLKQQGITPTLILTPRTSQTPSPTQMPITTPTNTPTSTPTPLSSTPTVTTSPQMPTNTPTNVPTPTTHSNITLTPTPTIEPTPEPPPIMEPVSMVNHSVSVECKPEGPNFDISWTRIPGARGYIHKIYSVPSNTLIDSFRSCMDCHLYFTSTINKSPNTFEVRSLVVSGAYYSEIMGPESIVPLQCP